MPKEKVGGKMKVIVNGILGRMGHGIAVKVQHQKKHQLVGGVDPHPIEQEVSWKIVSRLEDIIKEGDVVIDFSSPAGTRNAVKICMEEKKSLITGTTGLEDSLVQMLKEAGKIIPVIHSNNFSLGVNLLFQFVEYMTHKLGSLPFDIELIESHHRYKKDSPSGTAKTLLDIIQANVPDQRKPVFGRNGFQESREGQIGVHSIRGGGIVGIHEVQYLATNEVISIKHEALSREVFIDGVLYCLDKISELNAGYYTMKDILDLNG